MEKLNLQQIMKETSESVSNGHSIEKLEEWKILLKELNKDDKRDLKYAINILETVIKLKKSKASKSKIFFFSAVFVLVIFSLSFTNGAIISRVDGETIFRTQSDKVHIEKNLHLDGNFVHDEGNVSFGGGSFYVNGSVNVSDYLIANKIYLQDSGTDYMGWQSGDGVFQFSSGLDIGGTLFANDISGGDWTGATIDATDEVMTPLIYNTDGTTLTIQDNLDVIGAISNSNGLLKIQPDVQGDVELFGDADVGNGENSKYLYLRRQAAEGNSYMRMYISASEKGYFHSNVPMNFQAQQQFTINSVTDDIVLKVGDNTGTYAIRFKDSNNADIARINSDGLTWFDGPVGIGIDNPYHELDVYKNEGEGDITIRAYNSNESGVGRIVSGALGGGQTSMVSNSKSLEYLGIPPGFSGLSNNYGDMIFAVGSGGLSSERMRITDDGKVGIGTTNPTDQLHIYNGNMRIEGDSDPTFYFTRTSDNDTFGFKYDESENDFSIVMGNNNRNPSFLDDIMTFTPSFRVGIRQSNPTVEFDVNGNTRLDGNLEVTGTIEPLQFPSVTGAKLNLYGSNYALGVESSELRIASNADITFRTDGYSGTPDMIIEDDGDILMLNGKLGLGTLNPKEELHINSSNPQIIFEEYDAGNYEKVWEVGVTNEEFLIRTQNDVYSGTQTAMRIGCRGGTSIGCIEFPHGDVTIADLSGSGNDYACLDSTGKLFRSATAC